MKGIELGKAIPRGRRIRDLQNRKWDFWKGDFRFVEFYNCLK